MKLPRVHQRDALDWSRDKDAFGLVHEMRLGKTLTTIWHFTDDDDAERILVIAPLSVLKNWQDELTSFGIDSIILTGSIDQRVELATANWHSTRWFLLNKEGVIERGHRTSRNKPKAVLSKVCRLGWDAVVVDESTMLKNPKSLLSQCVCDQLRIRVDRRVILTGLPTPKDWRDLFQQMKFLFGRFCGCSNWWQFQDKFFQQGWSQYDLVPKRGALQTIKEEFHRLCHVRTRKQVGLDKEKVHQPRWLELPPKVRREYDLIDKDWKLAGVRTKFAVVKRQWLSQIPGGRLKGDVTLHHNSKLNELLELVGGEMQGQPMVLWFSYVAEVSAATKLLREKGYRVRSIHGAVPQAHRTLYRKQFQSGKVDYLCILVSSFKYGLNLSRASAALYYSMSDNPEDYYQSMDRILHMDKDGPLLYIYLLCRDTIDEDRYNALREGVASSRQLLRRMGEFAQLRRKVAA